MIMFLVPLRSRSVSAGASLRDSILLEPRPVAATRFLLGVLGKEEDAAMGRLSVAPANVWGFFFSLL
ncbi:hypothetical protein PF010_g22637 [Phytophthora fragariae]|uniref:Uncharacterized protein n=1 Tax=Phytophthora fragariae TaxID=53985 RepID=A0A6A3RTS6_9STRA|nr:hypothetical protein PF003_g8903 [Phytophthora fragariae]KAE8925863.1 hypothetical protein PF009_g23932 [Phytophthora fragariae]KAE8981529.1 hypothetical protein PF011_g21978 [Phytophthora fragariae]KAE9079750.1 hypothetical protein PF010_g22637 [Phytophthora fragariae]KAE9103800.1 hypothetical protein PF006_g22075 [Phytophthora fragariae]